MMCSVSTKIDDSALASITDLEKELGKTIVAYDCHSLSPSSLNDEQLKKLQDVESKLGCSLVALG